MEGEWAGDRGGIFHLRRCLLGGPSMCHEMFELYQNLWNSDRGTTKRTLDQGSKSFERSAVDWWWSRVHSGVRMCVCVCKHAFVFKKNELEKHKGRVWIWIIVFLPLVHVSRSFHAKGHVQLLRRQWSLSNETQSVAVLSSLVAVDNGVMANHRELDTAGAPL